MRLDFAKPLSSEEAPDGPTATAASLLHSPAYKNSCLSTISSVTRTFSADLNDAFSMDKKLDGLVQSVEQKKQAVSSQSQELEALEAKLRATEERLKEKQSSATAMTSDATGQEQQALSAASKSQGQSGLTAPDTYASAMPLKNTSDQAPSASTMSYWRPQMPGTLPETPGDSRHDSYLAEKRDGA
ncbi:MAG: hypothetical protein LQ344_002329 [Seirophora lacunosa]|nr:MAG: hypothetical protein LQ344_002329 [Seirophora lacunosa]